MVGSQGTDCSNPYCVAGAESPSPPETLTSHRILGEPLECTVFKTGGRGDEPRRWVRLPCALASSLHARSTALYVSWSTGRAVSFDPVHSGCTVQAVGVAV